MGTRSIKSLAAVLSLAVVGYGCSRAEPNLAARGREAANGYPSGYRSIPIEVADLQVEPGDAAGSTFSGTWSGAGWPTGGEDAQFCLTLGEASRTSTSFNVSAKEVADAFTADPAAAESRIVVTRDAGRMTIERPRGGAAPGTLRIAIDPKYVAEVAAITRAAPTSDQKLALFRADVSLAYAHAIHDAGYAPDVAGLLQLCANGISSSYAAAIRKAGYEFGISQVINLSRNGISSSYAAGLRDGGFRLDDAQIIKLSRNGISESYARDMRNAGYGDVDEIIDLSRNGISTSYAQGLGLGGKRNAKAIIDLSRNGVSASFSQAFAEAGYAFNDQELIQLGRNGVSSSYAKSLGAAGYKFGADDLISLNRNGVSSSYAAAIREAGYDFSAADLITLNRNGVSSSFIAALRDAAKPNLPADAIVDLNRRGVDVATVKKIRGM